MYTSDIKRELKTGIIYLSGSLIIAAAAAVYGLFSHGVYSYFMTYAFMIPLLGGAMPHLVAALKEKSLPGWVREDILLAVIATLTTGSLLKGALDIYGTTNRLLIAYPVLALLVTSAAVISGIRNNKAAGSAEGMESPEGQR